MAAKTLYQQHPTSITPNLHIVTLFHAAAPIPFSKTKKMAGKRTINPRKQALNLACNSV